MTKDGVWAAVPFGKKFMIINEGQQGEVFKTLDAAKAYIAKQVKSTKKQQKIQSKGTLTSFLQ